MRPAAWSPLLAASIVLACSASGQPAERHPRRAADVDLAGCLRIIEGTAWPGTARCPGFLVEPLTEALRICEDVGGKLLPAPDASVFALDVDADGADEYTFAHEGNVACEGAWSVFSCGSLGCPIVVYRQRRDGTWRPIATIDAPGAESIELLDAPRAGGYRRLRAGCAGGADCVEYRHYEWTGARYELAFIEVRGFRVNVGGPVHGLRTLAGETPLLATPTPGGRVLARYPAGTEVAVVGAAEGGRYLYVAPCNACGRGFVPPAATPEGRP